jgi:hypothetical protein
MRRVILTVSGALVACSVLVLGAAPLRAVSSPALAQSGTIIVTQEIQVHSSADDAEEGNSYNTLSLNLDMGQHRPELVEIFLRLDVLCRRLGDGV